MPKTRVYAQYVGGSGLDARYLGTVEGSPTEIAKHLWTVKGIVSVDIFEKEVIVYGHRPF